MHGITIVFTASIVMLLIAAAASLMRGEKFVHGEHPAAEALVAEAEEVTPAVQLRG
jgi:hypothetical protein